MSNPRLSMAATVGKGGSSLLCFSEQEQAGDGARLLSNGQPVIWLRKTNSSPSQPLSGGSPPACLPASREVARATATRPTPGQSTVTGDSLAGKCLSLQYSGMQYKMLKSKLERENQIPPDTTALYKPASEVTRRARGFCRTQTQLSPFQIF